MKSPLPHAVFALLVSIGALVGYRGWYSMIQQKSVAVASLENQIVANTETETRIAAARAALRSIESDEATLKSYFVPETEIVSFIEALEEKGKTQSVAVDVLSVAKGGTPARPLLTLSVSMRGAFDAVMRMVGALEYAPYALTLQGFSLQLEEKGAWRADTKLLLNSAPTVVATSTP